MAPSVLFGAELDADRRGKVLIRSDSGGSNDAAEQQLSLSLTGVASSVGTSGSVAAAAPCLRSRPTVISIISVRITSSVSGRCIRVRRGIWRNPTAKRC